jgi:hypothetical protein
MFERWERAHMSVPAKPRRTVLLFVQLAINSGHQLAAQIFHDREVVAGYYEFNIRNRVLDSIAEASLGIRQCPSN